MVDNKKKKKSDNKSQIKSRNTSKKTLQKKATPTCSRDTDEKDKDLDKDMEKELDKTKMKEKEKEKGLIIRRASSDDKKMEKPERSNDSQKKSNFQRVNEPSMKDQKSGYVLNRETAWAEKRLFVDKAISTISKEFKNNKTIKPSNFTIDSFKKNEIKNRYNDILCTDRTRVVLKNRPPEDDYIHASWVTMPDDQKYISTQGPIDETIEDFWHMVWTEKCKVIVMVCAFVEKEQNKCARYFVGCGAEVKHGPYKIKCKEEKADPFEEIKHTMLEMEHTDGQKVTVHHLANYTWTDHIAPEKPGPTVGMMRLAKKLCEKNPIVVHCSAGIGRTATFIAIDYASQKIKSSDNVNMLDILRELREMRFHAIQSYLQWAFLHACLLESFVQDGSIGRKGKAEDFFAKFQKQIKKYKFAKENDQEKEKEKEKD